MWRSGARNRWSGCWDPRDLTGLEDLSGLRRVAVHARAHDHAPVRSTAAARADGSPTVLRLATARWRSTSRDRRDGYTNPRRDIVDRVVRARARATSPCVRRW